MNYPGSTSQIKRAAIIAGMMLGIALLLKLLSPDYVDHELARRATGVIMGCIVVLYANAVPKQLTPLARLVCSPIAEQAFRRFMGISLVLGGAGFALAWALAPMGAANVVAAALLGSSLLAVALRCAVLFFVRTPD